MIDIYQLAVEKLCNVPAGWRWCGLNANDMPEDYIEIKGAVPIGTVSKGPRKGRSKWPKVLQTVFVRHSQALQVAREWELENNKCYRCEGTGQELAGCSVEHGSTYRKCSRCNGTGTPPEEASK